MDWTQLTGKILHGSIYLWWWTSHQSLAYEGLRILRFCIMSWKGEREPTIKLCMGRQIDVVQKFFRIQSLGQNWWWVNGIRVEYLPRIHPIAALPQSRRVTVWFSTTSHGDLKTMKKCESSAQLVSLHAKRFGAGQWSFFGPGSEKKWCSIGEDSPQGEWDRIAEQMMLTFAESGHPIFRSTSPLSRGTLKSKGGGKLSKHFCADEGTIETCSHNYFCQSAQYLRSSLSFVWRIQCLSNKNGETCCGRII